MNGSGKTTLFQGVKLCLYGRYLKGYRLEEEEYQQFLKEMIHRHSGLLEYDNASVSLEFEHVHLGKKSCYFVKRTWSTSTKLSEQLTVLQDGKPVDGVPSDQLQDFLMELIPLGLSNLFFFDGEQIQNLAEDEPNNRNLADAFNTLLGLDILHHLETDIGIHLSRKLQVSQSKAIAELSKLSHEHTLLSTELDQKRRLRAQKQTEIDNVMFQIDSEERSIVAQGGGFSTQRAQLKARKDALTKQIDSLEEKIRELSSSLFPFSIVPNLCERLKQRLLKEEEIERAALGNELLYKAITDVSDLVRSHDFWSGTDVTKSEREVLSERFINALKSTAVENNSQEVLILHHLSPTDQKKILGWIDQAVSWIPAELRQVTLSLESQLRDLHEVEGALTSIPPDETLAPFIQNLNALHEKLGSLRKEGSILDEAIRVLAFKIKENERLQTKGEDEQKQVEKDKDLSDLASKVRDLLREFSTTMKKKKLDQVSAEFVDAFNLLASKKNLVDRIEINGEDFALRIRRRDGVVIPKEQLSAGEKQIYAIAMLTALARVSGRPLPFIIDTPLARLDSQHRRNLVENFFPKVSHQVIMFSTNTEIDKEYFELLEPYVSRAFLLSYDEGKESSSEYPGYFWKPTKVVGQV
jgi:DNA sulfur modification protein DndD